MLASITPLGERGRHNRWSLTASAYVIGVLVGGAALGTLAGSAGATLGNIGRPSLSARLGVVAALSVAAMAFDLSLGGIRLPTVRRQVNEDWLATYRGWVYGLGFGVQLGFGVVTIVSTAGLYLTFTLAFLSGSVTAGLVVGCAFGLSRALPILAVRRVRTSSALKMFHQRLDAARRAAGKGAVGAEALVVLTALCLALARVQ
jgi:hypothetical protein